MPLMPNDWLPRPPTALYAESRAGFEQIYDRHIRPAAGQAIRYDRAAPKWPFLA